MQEDSNNNIAIDVYNDKIDMLEESWRSFCPPLYRESLESKLPCERSVIEKVNSWNGSKGLLLHGLSRKGKTRLAFMALKRMFKQGKQIKFFDAVDFGIAASGAYRDGSEKDFYRSLIVPDFVFLDDLGKCKLTARVSEALFGMVDKRLQRNKQCVFTLNFTGDALKQRFDDQELGTALYNRLIETCEVIKV
jgi:DNA replication protein DnaC